MDLSGEKDEEKVQKAFLLAQALLSRKAMEAELYKEETEDKAKELSRLETTGTL